MTEKAKTDLIEGIIKSGSFISVLSLAVWILWSALERKSEEVRKETFERIQLLERTSKECSENYKDLLLLQLETYGKALEKSNVIIERIEKKINI